MQYKRKLSGRIDLWLQLHFPRYKLWRVSKALGIKPHPWQRDFALRKTDSFGDAGMFRQTGKTMAVMLRILMRTNMFVEPYMFADDPDWLERDKVWVKWYIHKYRNLSFRCAAAGIPVPALPLKYPPRQ